MSPCFEAHHEATTEYLILCHGSRFDIVLNGYLPKKPKHPTTCAECGFYKGYCQLGYKTAASWSSCRQGIEKTAKKGF